MFVRNLHPLMLEPGLLPLLVCLQARRIGDLHLAGHVVDGLGWDIDRIGEEDAEEPDRPKLDPKPETVRVATPPVNEQPVGIIEEEEALQLTLRRSAGEAAVSRRLLISEELNRHRPPT